MKHFLIEITYTVPFDELDDIRPEHRSFLQIGYEKGWLLMSGPLIPRTRAMVVARAPTLEGSTGLLRERSLPDQGGSDLPVF